MLGKFRGHFSPDREPMFDVPDRKPDFGSDLDAILAAAEGYSLECGLYRLIRPQDRAKWAERVALVFPDHAGRVSCFGFDWLGRAFATDHGRTHDGQPNVVMFEPGTAETLLIPADIVSFHERELVDHRDAALACSFFQEWQSIVAQKLQYNRCAGYRNPVFLGGLEGMGCRLLCAGSRRDVYLSGMARSMGSARRAYVFHQGKPATVLVDIFEDARLEEVSTVSEQRLAFEAWGRSLRDR